MKKFPFYKQADQKDCGPTCIRIIAKYYGKTIPIQTLRRLAETTREGSSLLGLSEAAEKMGFHTLGVQLNFDKLVEATLPCILHWNKEHFVVLYKIKNDKTFISDPAHGLISYRINEFIKFWIGQNADRMTKEGIALLIQPTPKFYGRKKDQGDDEKFDFRFISRYLFKYKKFIVQLIIGLLAGSLLQLVVPFLTQSIVDVGIQNQDINFIYLILLAQLFLFLGRTALEVIRGWILLHLSTRINVSLISDFFYKVDEPTHCIF